MLGKYRIYNLYHMIKLKGMRLSIYYMHVTGTSSNIQAIPYRGGVLSGLLYPKLILYYPDYSCWSGIIALFVIAASSY